MNQGAVSHVQAVRARCFRFSSVFKQGLYKHQTVQIIFAKVLLYIVMIVLSLLCCDNK